MTLQLSAALLCLAAVPLSAQVFADLVLVDGKIWTENPQQPEAAAIAILGNRIVAVGATADVMKLAGPATKVVQLDGKRVVPGFNDAHVHFTDGGAGLAGVQLRDADTPAEFRRRIGAFASTQPKGTWILYGEWDHERWTPAQIPAHQLIDDVTADNPVFVERLDGHMSLANALAMKLAGVTKDTKDVDGGVIVRDGQGNPTGIFKDAAQDLIGEATEILSRGSYGKDYYQSSSYETISLQLREGLLKYGDNTNEIAIQAFPLGDRSPFPAPFLSSEENTSRLAFIRNFFNVYFIQASFVISLFIGLYFYFFVSPTNFPKFITCISPSCVFSSA